VLVLYRLTRDIVPARRATQQRIAFTAASLHVLSPAGLFLSAPYGESAFALANFAGMLCYVTARRRRARGCGGVRAAGWDLAAGFLFGTASLIRSNGLLSGLVFAWDAVVHVSGLGSILRQRRWASLLQFAVTVLSGSFVAIGYALPQFEAYMRYCTGDVVRPWCGNWIPSVYSFVQSHYWNVGFLRYWTLSNLPLFALALPMIVVLVATSLVVLDGRQHRQFLGLITADERDSSESKDVSLHDEDVFWDTMRRFALPQAVLAILAVTSFHVQIINRISSGYPIWYIVLAIAIHAPRTNKVHRGVMGSLLANAGWLVRASVMYAIVQGGLYASFMPPA
jgi:phosphatidylinositol glycan class V